MPHIYFTLQVRVKPGSKEIFASCSVDSNIIIWNVSHKKDPLVHKLSDHLSYVTSVQWIPGSDKLVSASFDHTIKIWDTGQGKLLHSLEKHKDAVTRISISADNNYLLSSGQDGDVNFWDLKVSDRTKYPILTK